MGFVNIFVAALSFPACHSFSSVATKKKNICLQTPWNSGHHWS